MFVYVITFIVIFAFVAIACTYCLYKNILVIKNLYLFIPVICIGIWAIYSHISQDPAHIFTWDVEIVYLAGNKVLTDPANLYTVPTYQYMPNCAIFLAFTLAIFPISIAYWVLFLYNYIWAIFATREFDKILILIKIKEKIHRFIFLMIISNGYWVYMQFFLVQTKYLTFLLLLIVVRREFQFNKDQIVKDFKYYAINFNLLILAVGFTPQFLIYLIVYIFHDIPYKKIFEKENVKKYGFVAVFFVIQNFFFIIFPHQIFGFLRSFTYVSRRTRRRMQLIYLSEWVEISEGFAVFLNIPATIAFIIIILILIGKSHLAIQEKFGYLSIASVLIGVQFQPKAPCITYFSFILLMFVPYLNQDIKGIEFFRKNKFCLMGIFSILIINFLAYYFIAHKFLLPPKDALLIILYNIRWIIFLSIMLISLILLKLKFKNLDEEI